MEFFDSPLESIDLTQSPREPWFHTAYFFARTTHNISVLSANWIQDSFENKNRLRDHLDFLAHHFDEGVRGTIDTLDRVWFFPWTEAATELRYAFANTLAGLHRASIDHQRRALELVIVGAYFTSDSVDEKAGTSWLNSETDTPRFSRAMKALAKGDLIARLNQLIGWSDLVSKHYWMLCDTVHVRGYEHSLSRIQNAGTYLDGLLLPSFSPAALERGLTLLIKTSEQMMVALSVANPILLFGVPIEEKYGLNGPIGFYTEGQAEALRELLPAELLKALVEVAAQDEGVISLREHFDKLSDLAPDAIEQQVEDFKQQMEGLRRDT